MMRRDSPARVVLITGAAGGIGSACAKAFAATGARVVLADIDAKGSRLSSGLGARQALFVRTDLRDEGSVRALVNAAIERWGRLDVLVNNAAVLMPSKPVHETTTEEFDALVGVNLRGPYLLCRHAYRHLKRSKGCIVNVSSLAGVFGEKNHAIYSATKGALNALTHAMALDYAADGIRCNAVCPAGVSTPNSVRAIRASPDAAKLLRMRDSIHALGKTASPAEVASVVVFLASPEASFMTGTIVPVSGGADSGYGIKY